MRVLVVDHHPQLREALEHVLARMDGALHLGEATNAFEAAKAVRESSWDCVLVAIAMPDRAGLELLKDLRREHPDLPVLILSAYPEEQYAAQMLRAGASGCLNKENAAEQLPVAIQTVLRGEKYLSPRMAAKVAATVSKAKARGS